MKKNIWLRYIILACFVHIGITSLVSVIFKAQKNSNFISWQTFLLKYFPNIVLEKSLKSRAGPRGSKMTSLGQKNYMFLRHCPHQLQPPRIKNFALPVFTLKNCLYIYNCQFKLAIICCHFVCFCAAQTESRKFLEITL